jgi:hypothetical protein
MNDLARRSRTTQDPTSFGTTGPTRSRTAEPLPTLLGPNRGSSSSQRMDRRIERKLTPTSTDLRPRTTSRTIGRNHGSISTGHLVRCSQSSGASGRPTSRASVASGIAPSCRDWVSWWSPSPSRASCSGCANARREPSGDSCPDMRASRSDWHGTVRAKSRDPVGSRVGTSNPGRRDRVPSRSSAFLGNAPAIVCDTPAAALCLSSKGRPSQYGP